MTLEDRENIKKRLTEAYKKYHYESEVIKGYANNIKTYDDNPFYVQLESDFENDPEINFKITREWFKDLYRTEKGRSPKFMNYVEAYITIACKRYESVNSNRKEEKNTLLDNEQTSNDFVIDINGLRYNSSNDAIQAYLRDLAKKHKKIKLDIVDFEMDISDVVELKLKKADIYKEELLRKKEAELPNILEQYGNDSKVVTDFRNQIKVLKKEIKTKFEILDLIYSGNDIFIIAPAGGGKTTILQWITFHFATNTDQKSINYLPILVELKFYENNIKKSVVNILDKLEIQKDSITQFHIIMLIDGYDEFTGNYTELFTQLNQLKEDYNLQFITSGRQLANFDRIPIRFISYNLNPLSIKDIGKLYKKIVPKKWKGYVRLLKDTTLYNTLSNPLYLTLFFVYLRDENNFQINKAIELINNKGKFMKTILIDHFLLKYEKSKEEDTWEIDVFDKIHLLSVIALSSIKKYGNKELLPITFVRKIVREEVLLLGFSQNFDFKKLIKSYKKHNLLKQYGSNLMFERKEIRIFFSALNLSKTINSLKEYQSIALRFQIDMWASIKEYLLGIIKNDTLITFPLKTEHGFLISEEDNIVLQTEKLTDLINNGNYGTGENYFSGFDLVNFLFKNILLSWSFETNFGKWIESLKKGDNRNLVEIEYEKRKEIIKESIGVYIRLYPDSHYLLSTSKYIILNDVVKSAKSRLKSSKNPTINDLEGFENYFLENTKTTDFFDLMYHYFHLQITNKELHLWKYYSVKGIMTGLYSNYTTEFINYFFERKTCKVEVSIFHELVVFLGSIVNSLHSKIDFNRLGKDYQKIFIENMLLTLKYYNQVFQIKKLQEFTFLLLDDAFKLKLKKAIINKIETKDIHVDLNYGTLQFFAPFADKNDLKIFIELIDVNKIQLTILIMQILSEWLHNNQYSKTENKKIMDVMESLLTNDLTCKSIKEAILQDYCIYNDPDDRIKNMILKLYHLEEKSYTEYLLKYYERNRSKLTTKDIELLKGMMLVDEFRPWAFYILNASTSVDLRKFNKQLKEDSNHFNEKLIEILNDKKFIRELTHQNFIKILESGFYVADNKGQDLLHKLRNKYSKYIKQLDYNWDSVDSLLTMLDFRLRHT